MATERDRDEHGRSAAAVGSEPGSTVRPAGAASTPPAPARFRRFKGRLTPLQWPPEHPHWRVPFYIEARATRTQDRCSQAAKAIHGLQSVEFFADRFQGYLICSNELSAPEVRDIAVRLEREFQEIVFTDYVDRLPREQRTRLKQVKEAALKALVDFPEEILDAINEIAIMTSKEERSNPALVETGAQHDAEVLSALERVVDNPHLDESGSGSAGTDLLGAIATRAWELEEAKGALAGAVEDARSRGYSWSGIGEVLGITGEAARKRWDPSAKKKHAEDERAARARSRS